MISKRKVASKSRTTRKKQSTVTIQQIANEVGVSTATVSRVLNSPNLVKQNTRNKILQVIHDRHYISDARAASLASQRSQTIGLLIPTIINSIYASFTQAIQQTCQDSGYTVLIGITDYSENIEYDLVTRLLERRVDGFILTGVERDKKIYDRIHHMRVPFITTWRSSRYKEVPSFSFSNYAAATQAVEYLIELGHHRIGLICGRTDNNDRARERQRAYIDTLVRNGLQIDTDLMKESSFEFNEGQMAMTQILKKQPRLTAVFCANDIQAVGAIHACRDCGYEVPSDISIIGFDDHPVTEHVTPQLTTIRVPAHEMGNLSAINLINTITDIKQPQSAKLETQLVIRESTQSVKTDLVRDN